MFVQCKAVICNKILPLLALAAMLALLSVANSARADTFCVGTSAELTNSLILAANLDGNHSVRLRKGVYPMGDFFNYNDNRGGDLSMSGGWNSGCTSRDTDPFDTVIQGNGSSRWFFNSLDNNQINITIELLRFVNFTRIAFSDFSSDPDTVCAGSQKRFRLARIVMDSIPGDSERLDFTNYCHRIEVENTLLVGGGTGVAILTRALPIRFVHNTIVGAMDHGLDILRLQSPDLTEVDLYNNIFYGHGLSDVRAEKSRVHAIANIWGELELLNLGGGYLDPGSFDNTTANPQLASNGRPIEPGSPAINSGYLSIPGGIPDLDIEGNHRLIGTKPDRGAFETPVSDSITLLVTDPNDSGPGTLRAAILSANASPGPKGIQFFIPGSCPQSIFLQSPLPLLNTNALLTIDGYSQSGSQSNTLDHGNDATICIQLRKSGSIPNLPYALRVPSGSTTTLRLKGIGFGGAGNAVELAGGSNHLIQGNRFGDTLIGNEVGVKIFSGSNNSTIGGLASNAYRNTIADSSIVGIWVIGSSSVEISNNYIGTNGNGLLAAPNATGISVAGAVGTNITGNVISANLNSGVVLNGAATDRTVITSNRIGLMRESNVRPNELGNGDAGILVTNGAHDSRIGGTLRDSRNIIVANAGAGVAIASGQHNTITNNSISRNGGLAIDLASTGVLPNDDDSISLPADFANRGLNHPILTSAGGDHAGGTVMGTLSSTRGSYRIELFMDTSCDASGHGEGGTQIGAVDVTMPNIPGQHTVAFSAQVQGSGLALNGSISATATDSSGNTSEFSACIAYDNSDLIFADDFE